MFIIKSDNKTATWIFNSFPLKKLVRLKHSLMLCFKASCKQTATLLIFGVEWNRFVERSLYIREVYEKHWAFISVLVQLKHSSLLCIELNMFIPNYSKKILDSNQGALHKFILFLRDNTGCLELHMLKLTRQ